MGLWNLNFDGKTLVLVLTRELFYEKGDGLNSRNTAVPAVTVHHLNGRGRLEGTKRASVFGTGAWFSYTNEMLNSPTFLFVTILVLSYPVKMESWSSTQYTSSGTGMLTKMLGGNFPIWIPSRCSILKARVF